MPGFSRDEMSEFEEMLRRLTDSGNRAADAQDELADEAEGNDADGRVDAAGEGGGAEGPSAQPIAPGGGGFGGFGGGFPQFSRQQVQVIQSNVQQAGASVGQGAGLGQSIGAGIIGGGLGLANQNPLARFGLNVTGVNAAQQNATQAGANVGGRLAQLAEQGVEITDEDISRQLEFEAPRIARANAVRARANALAQQNIGDAAAEGTAVAETNNLLRQILGALNGGGGF